MILEKVVVGPLAVNSYIIGCEQTRIGAVIDPGDEAEKIEQTIAQLNLQIKFILLTHGHIDHLAHLQRLQKKYQAKFLMHEADSFLLEHASSQAELFELPDPGNPQPDAFLNDGDKITLGNLTISVLHTPGHSPGSVTFFVEDKLFVGDLIFSGSIGRTDLPGGNFEQLIHSVNTKIFVLPDAVEIFPGHGTKTTVGFEKSTNPFFN